ncbi:unnamed protein product [Durusdinium trenchii]|uniref:ELMO domain-containing protein n=1 Tax=Durusdinium trenchii TaxID=1381693 RepID=A0ABP0MW40_9DINO
MEQERLMEEGRTDEQPHIEDQKSFCDRCIVCLGPRYVTLLTEEERDAVWHMRRQVVNNPKPEDAELQKQVLLLWNTAFPDEKLDLFEKGQGWKKLGFQGTDPSTDVRTGSWPLEQLVALATHHPTEFRRMVQEASHSASFYLFAISCFNVSHMLVLFFDLHTFASVSPLGHVPRASKRQLRNLARLAGLLRWCHPGKAGDGQLLCRGRWVRVMKLEK